MEELKKKEQSQKSSTVTKSKKEGVKSGLTSQKAKKGDEDERSYYSEEGEYDDEEEEYESEEDQPKSRSRRFIPSNKDQKQEV